MSDKYAMPRRRDPLCSSTPHVHTAFQGAPEVAVLVPLLLLASAVVVDVDVDERALTTEGTKETPPKPWLVHGSTV